MLLLGDKLTDSRAVDRGVEEKVATSIQCTCSPSHYRQTKLLTRHVDTGTSAAHHGKNAKHAEMGVEMACFPNKVGASNNDCRIVATR